MFWQKLDMGKISGKKGLRKNKKEQERGRKLSKQRGKKQSEVRGMLEIIYQIQNN